MKEYAKKHCSKERKVLLSSDFTIVEVEVQKG